MDKNNIQDLFNDKISEAMDRLRESVSRTLVTECKCGCDKPECEDELDEAAKLFNSDQLNKLRAAYSGINKIDPSGPASERLMNLLDKMSDEQLKQLSNASVKFVSAAAAARLKEDLNESEQHYSAEILSKLVMMGWHREAGGVSKVYKGIRASGELSNGDRIVHAEFDPRNRYLIAFLGFDEVMDMDMRDKGDARKAAMEFEKVLATKLKGFKEDLDEDMIDLYLDEATNEEYYIELNEETLEERKIVIRVTSKGKRIKRIKCPPGRVLKNVGGRQVCVTPTGSQRIKKRIAIRKSVRTKKSKGTGYKKRITFKRNRAVRFRKSMGIRSQ